MMSSPFLFLFSWPLSLLLCLPSWLWEQCEGRALPQLFYCLEEMHWQLHLIDSFIIALLMMTFPILSVQLFSSLWFQLLIIPHQSALIWWGSQQSYCFPHSQLLLSVLPQPACRSHSTEGRAANNIKGGGDQHFDTSAEGCDWQRTIQPRMGLGTNIYTPNTHTHSRTYCAFNIFLLNTLKHARLRFWS